MPFFSMAPLPRFEINNGSSIAVQARLRSSEDLLKIGNPYAAKRRDCAGMLCHAHAMLCSNKNRDGDVRLTNA